jgi:hypothetical protein
MAQRDSAYFGERNVKGLLVGERDSDVVKLDMEESPDGGDDGVGGADEEDVAGLELRPGEGGPRGRASPCEGVEEAQTEEVHR